MLRRLFCLFLVGLLVGCGPSTPPSDTLPGASQTKAPAVQAAPAQSQGACTYGFWDGAGLVRERTYRAGDPWALRVDCGKPLHAAVAVVEMDGVIMDMVELVPANSEYTAMWYGGSMPDAVEPMTLRWHLLVQGEDGGRLESIGYATMTIR